ncbi:asparaginase [Paraburkholderia lycopersici]|uniref:Asparaginase n=1 Tax=Paraburkholderia lycopersici TaxID=416944 RepID=A0A1G6RKT1_9BURK|nr:asparaginase [Paraburkholderia lycopersici]SDD04974.1 asparaginase [Paraburkholderia lycopersici]
MTTNATQPAVKVLRGGVIETTHAAHVAVTDAQGRLLYAFGDPYRLTLVRSAAKPAQALAVVETGALERCGFDDADLALMCASHSSEDRHIERVRAMLAKVCATEADLRCGGHPPLSDAVYKAWIKRDFTPGAVCSNCSGKHAGMLAGARSIGAALADYHLPSHPLQQQVKRVVAGVCDLPEANVEWAIDGCNLPTPAFPLDRLARLFVKLADAQDRRAAAAGSRTLALARIYRAMTSYPELVAGEGRFCTTLMRAFEGALVGKVGAAGSYAIGVRASAATAPHTGGPALGIAVKVEDGDQTVLYAVVVEVLRQLGIGTTEQIAQLSKFDAPRIVNTMGVETGYVAPQFRLERIDCPPCEG